MYIYMYECVFRVVQVYCRVALAGVGVCVCVRENERENEREKEREGGERERVCVYIFRWCSHGCSVQVHCL